MKRLLPFVAAFAALALGPAGALAQSKNTGKTHVRHIFVSVLDAKGAAVEGLSIGVDLWPPAILIPLGPGRLGFADR